MGGTGCRSGKDFPLDFKVGKELPYSCRAEPQGPPVVVEENEAFNPAEVHSFGPEAVVFASSDFVGADKRAGRIGDVHGIWPIRSPHWRIPL